MALVHTFTHTQEQELDMNVLLKLWHVQEYQTSCFNAPKRDVEDVLINETQCQSHDSSHVYFYERFIIYFKEYIYV